VFSQVSTPDFEWDAAKSRASKLKYGIDLVEAQALWQDGFAITVVARAIGESRSMVIGTIDGRHWSAIVTQRGERVRIISVRRSRLGEVHEYEER
jgi:uncharacterized protein